MASKLASIADRNENNFIAGNLPKGTLVLIKQNQQYFNTHIKELVSNKHEEFMLFRKEMVVVILLQ
jgi:hypothetical protein